MSRVTEEEFDRLEAEQRQKDEAEKRHREILALLRSLIEKPETKVDLSGIVQRLEALSEKEVDLSKLEQDVQNIKLEPTDLSEIEQAIKEVKMSIKAAKTLTPIRDRYGFIEKIVVEY